MAKKQRVDLRVSSEQKDVWMGTADLLGTDTSTLLREAMDGLCFAVNVSVSQGHQWTATSGWGDFTVSLRNVSTSSSSS